jgi:hypothetical protein
VELADVSEVVADRLKKRSKHEIIAISGSPSSRPDSRILALPRLFIEALTVE